MFDGQPSLPENENEIRRKQEARARRIANLRPRKKGDPALNPRGRPKKDLDLAKTAQQHAEEAIQALVKVMKDDDSPASARVSAASEILDRGFGKAPQHGSLNIEHSFSQQFEDFIRQLQSERNAQKQLEVIDIEASDSSGSPESPGRHFSEAAE